MSGDAKRGDGKTPPFKPLARANELALPQSRVEKVAYIANMMRNLQWRKGKSAAELAIEWGMAETSVRDISGEASRIVRMEMVDPDATNAIGLTKLEKLVDDSMAAANGDDSPAVHRKVAMEGLKLLLTLTGAAAPQKVELSAANLSDDEVERRLLAAMAKVQALVAKGREKEAEELEGEVVAPPEDED